MELQYTYNHSTSNTIIEDNSSVSTDINISVESKIKSKRYTKGTFDIKEVDNSSSVPEIIRLNPLPIFKQWEGRIISIEDSNIFLARVYEINHNGAGKIIRFDKRKILFENEDCIAEGASFIWKVGIFYTNGTAYKKSLIRFRHISVPNPLLIKESEEEIARIFDNLSWSE